MGLGKKFIIMVINLLGSSLMASKNRVLMSFRMVRGILEHFRKEWCQERESSSSQMEIVIMVISDQIHAMEEDYTFLDSQIDSG